jgi:hypothetical protein
MYNESLDFPTLFVGTKFSSPFALATPIYSILLIDWRRAVGDVLSNPLANSVNGFLHSATAALTFQYTVPTGWYRRGAISAPFSTGAARTSGAPLLSTGCYFTRRIASISRPDGKTVFPSRSFSESHGGRDDDRRDDRPVQKCEADGTRESREAGRKRTGVLVGRRRGGQFKCEAVGALLEGITTLEPKQRHESCWARHEVETASHRRY